MKAVTARSYGNSRVLEVHDHTADPAPEKDQILVRVRGVGINPFDVALVSGAHADRIPLRHPFIPCGDFSGIVSAVHDNVGGFAVGDEVYGTATVASGGSGAMAEQTVVHKGRVAKKPASATFLQAAALPLVGTSVIAALEEHMKLTAGDRILIHGGSGGIGHLAIQFAKHLGAYVAATVRADDFDFAKGLGADEVIDYKTQDFGQLLSDFDAVYDTVGGTVTAKSFFVLRRGGILVSMKGLPDQEEAARHGVTAIGLNTDITADRLERLARLVDSGAVTVHVDQVFPVDRIRDAWDLQVSGGHRGKIVISIT